MKKGQRFGLLTCLLLFTTVPVSVNLMAQQKKAPIMGWSSWNSFRVNINEKLIKEQADAMVTTGLYNAGYRYINIDDGYFGGRDSSGKLLADPVKFATGMRALTDYIHLKKLKAGVYTDAGANTCGSIYDKDLHGIGVGIYGHIVEDCNLFFKDWAFDFLKVDWCGGKQLQLNDEQEYTAIINAAKNINSNIIVNVCRWEFPGKWVIKKADSWRISTDIRPTFSSVLRIIDINAGLYAQSSEGHFNDMDMLQVGRGMSYEEDKTHFSMWCMLNSPLLAGNDLRNMSKQTIEILTNKELIDINQDESFFQAQRVYSKDSIEVWKRAIGKGNGQFAIALLNRGNSPVKFNMDVVLPILSPLLKIRDLWQHKELGRLGTQRGFNIPAHGSIILKARK